MKFKVNLAGLMVGLKPVTTVSSTNEKKEYPDAYKVTLVAKKDHLVIEAYNGYVAISNTVDNPEVNYSVETTGDATLRSVELLNTLNSFPADDDLTFELVQNEIVIRGASMDKEEFQSIPIAPTRIAMPAPSPSYSKQLSISRDALIEGMGHVLFAVGFEKYRPQFLYWKIRVSKNGIRFVAGDGGRFVAYQKDGQNLADGDVKEVLLFGEQTKDLLPKLVPMFDVPEVLFKISNSSDDSEGSVPDQVVISLGTAIVTLMGYDPGIKWPNEDKFLERVNRYKMTASLQDFELAIRGMDATNNEEIKKRHDTHYATLKFDFNKKVLSIMTDQTMKSLRKLKMRDTWVDSTVGNELVFTCTSVFVSEMFKHGNKNDFIQIEALDEKAAVVMRYFAGEKLADTPIKKVNAASGVSEEYTIFFASSEKDKAK